VYQPPFRTVLGFQASHVDTSFYDRFYKPEALSEAQSACGTASEVRCVLHRCLAVTAPEYRSA
jgi:hypothetical protein